LDTEVPVEATPQDGSTVEPQAEIQQQPQFDPSAMNEAMITQSQQIQQIAEQMGGEINLSSNLGRGSYFSFSFPLRGMKSKDNDEIKNTAEKKFKGWENITVLIAEDDPNNFLFYEIILKKKIKRLDHAWNGKDAVNMVNKYDYDLILMDIKMPIMDGLEATKRIKAKYPDLPVVAQTAYTSAEEKKGILAAGCDEYISKPVKKQKLLEILHKYALR
jgi:CheY-like chemotaxis protein